MSDRYCNNVRIHKTCLRIDQHFPERAVRSPVKFNWKLQMNPICPLRGWVLVTLFRSSVSSGRNNVTMTVAHGQTFAARCVRGRRARRAADRLCTVASFPTIKLRQVSALAACVWAAAVHSSWHSRRLPLTVLPDTHLYDAAAYAPTCIVFI